MKWNTDDTDDTDTHGFCICVNPSNPCHPCSKSLRQAFNTVIKNAKHNSNILCDFAPFARRALHVTHDNPNKVWLDVYPGIFNGSLLESYEVVIRDNKVESYRRDYPDAQAGFTGMRCRSTSRH